MPNSTINERLRALTLPLAILAALAAFAVAMVLSPIVMGEADPPPDMAGPVTPREVVATGSVEGFPDWELTVAENAKGEPCIGFGYLLTRGGGTGRSFGEACGGPFMNNQVGSETGPNGTIFFGRVTGKADKAKVKFKGALKKQMKAFKGKDGKSYVVASAPGEKLGTAEIELVDSNGASLGRVDPGALSTP
jgi:hypothetical protein